MESITQKFISIRMTTFIFLCMPVTILSCLSHEFSSWLYEQIKIQTTSYACLYLDIHEFQQNDFREIPMITLYYRWFPITTETTYQIFYFNCNSLQNAAKIQNSKFF